MCARGTLIAIAAYAYVNWLLVIVKTVEVHLSNVYRKLDVASRRQLAIALGEDPTP